MIQLFAAALTACLVTSATGAHPDFYMYTSGGSLVRTSTDAGTLEIIGTNAGDIGSIMDLKRDGAGRLVANFGLEVLSNGTFGFGAMKVVDPQDASLTTISVLSEDPLLSNHNGFPALGGMAVDSAGDFWFLGEGFVPGFGKTLIQYDPVAGAVIQVIDTDAASIPRNAIAFRDDGMLVTFANVASFNNRVTVIDPATGLTQLDAPTPGIGNVVSMERFGNTTYLSTSLGEIYTIDLYTFDYELVASFAEYSSTPGVQSFWGLAVVPAPGATTPLFAAIALTARRRRKARTLATSLPLSSR